MRRINHFLIMVALATSVVSCSKASDHDVTNSIDSVSTIENGDINDSLAPIEEVPYDTLEEQSFSESSSERSAFDQTKEIFAQGIRDFNACQSADDVYQALSKFVKNQGRLSLLQDKMTGQERIKTEKMGADLAKTISHTIQKHQCDQSKIDKIFSGM